MTPIRILGKVSLSDEIKMLDEFRRHLRACKEQARLIEDTTGDEGTKDRIQWTKTRLDTEIDGIDLLYFRAVEAQCEMGEETGRVTLREDLGR